MIVKRVLPIGAEPAPEGGVHLRTWAPRSAKVYAERFDQSGLNPVAEFQLKAEGDGYFSGHMRDLNPGDLYKLRVDGGSFADPASRFQPFGPHGPSRVVDASKFPWTDGGWRGLPLRSFVLYEMHLGTFTPDGTWAAAQEQLTELKRLGITALEIMPISDFPGNFGWGYDGVNLFAPSRLYGSPDDARRFVDKAHELGMMVLLDVVYNHFGPDGNYLGQFSKSYCHAEKKSEWGDALNFDGEDCEPVREFFLSNVLYWITEYHFDGLRLDATHEIIDNSSTHILADISRIAEAAGQGRNIVVIAENGKQESRLARAYEKGGYGIHALWNDDFHHSAMVAATGHSDGYYYDYKGTAQEFVSLLKHGYLYQGQWSHWMQHRFGSPAFDLSPINFINYLQNHDQVANSLRGARLHQLAAPGTTRALTAILLLGPAIPLLFQGQEFGTSAPFIYFANHGDDLSAKIREGRTKFLQQFRAIASQPHPELPPDPAAEETFKRCKLDFTERQTHHDIYKLHEDLLRLRREDPTLAHAQHLDGAVLGRDAFVLRFFSATGDDRLLLVNFGGDLILDTAPEPLLAPIENCGWKILWSSEAIEYGGGGTAPLETTNRCSILGRAAVLLAPSSNADLPRAKFSAKD